MDTYFHPYSTQPYRAAAPVHPYFRDSWSRRRTAVQGCVGGQDLSNVRWASRHAGSLVRKGIGARRQGRRRGLSVNATPGAGAIGHANMTVCLSGLGLNPHYGTALHPVAEGCIGRVDLGRRLAWHGILWADIAIGQIRAVRVFGRFLRVFGLPQGCK